MEADGMTQTQTPLRVEANPSPSPVGGEWLAKVALPDGVTVALRRCSCGCDTRAIQGSRWETFLGGEWVSAGLDVAVKRMREHFPDTPVSLIREAVELLFATEAML